MPALDPLALVGRLRTVLPAGVRHALHEPSLGGRERDYVLDCLDSGWVSYLGRHVEAFEQRLAAICGTGFAVATASGTAALHAALLVAGVRRDDEVVIPALTFVATANAVAHCGALPHFAEVEERTLGLDAAALARHLDAVADRRDGVCINRESGRPIRAVVPVHCFGVPVDMAPLLAVAEAWHLTVVEDAAEALGSRYHDRPAGSLGRLAAFSFNGNKIVTTGGGGAVVTDDAALAHRLRHLTTTAKLPHPWRFDHDEVGYNYRLTNLNAALGCAQLERLDHFVTAKRTLRLRYAEALAGLAGIALFHPPAGFEGNNWLITALLDQADPTLLDQLLAALHAAGILARPAWTPMHRLPMWTGSPRMALPVTESLAARLLCLPSSAGLAA